MPKFWMQHGPGVVRRVAAGQVACDLHAGAVGVDDCRACPRFVALLHEPGRSSVLCRGARRPRSQVHPTA
jgi:hypothetical protein